MAPEIWSLTDRNFCHFGQFGKKHLEILSVYTSVPKVMIISYTVPEIWHMTDVIVLFYFGLFFALLPPLTARKMKISKKY